MARQAVWAAKVARKNGDRASAMDFLQTARKFAHKYAVCKPRRIIPFLVGRAMWSIVVEQEVEILRETGDAERLQAIERERTDWIAAIEELRTLVDETSVTVESVKAAPGADLVYTDYAAEEAGVEKVLAEVGLLQ